ncbi:MAG: type II toxin-antitoxin system VapB family antitoxin [Ammonifex sp.]|jgi:Arc/MetJ family transcription regulator|nr:MAG: type II toxin-antitoxin system VapB family antitoxin [Ammonifex sp.]
MQMRTTVNIDRTALEEAMRLAGSKRQSEVLNMALKEFIRRRRVALLQKRLGNEDLAVTLKDVEAWRGER